MLLDRVIKFFTSLKLTVVCLALGIVLVFWGTLAQVHLGLFKAQNEFFRSFFVYWQPAGSTAKIPIFPGGYLVGIFLLINLLAAHFQRFTLTRKKFGIWLIHFGIILLIVGQLLTDVLSQESAMHMRIGETKNYSEADRAYELVVTDVTDKDMDTVVAISEHLLVNKGEASHPEMPFVVRSKAFFLNSSLTTKGGPGYEKVPATQGIGPEVWWHELPRETAMDRRDVPSGVIEIVTPKGSLGTWLVSGHLANPQVFTYDAHMYQLTLRPVRYYKPFSLHLIEFKHDKYPGTDIPKNFSSRVRLQNVENGDDREVLIYMNNPLRYDGETYYQASFDTDDKGSILQVVRNPSWLTPYFSCVLVAAGLLVQFLSHLVGFATKRKTS